jgi:hypothetical protein
LPSFFLKNKQYFSFMQVFGLFLLCFQRKNVERFNVKVMAATVLNSTQVHLLQMFQVDDSQKGLEELCRRHYQLAIIILIKKEFFLVNFLEVTKEKRIFAART